MITIILFLLCSVYGAGLSRLSMSFGDSGYMLTNFTSGENPISKTAGLYNIASDSENTYLSFPTYYGCTLAFVNNKALDAMIIGIYYEGLNNQEEESGAEEPRWGPSGGAVIDGSYSFDVECVSIDGMTQSRDIRGSSLDTLFSASGLHMTDSGKLWILDSGMNEPGKPPKVVVIDVSDTLGGNGGRARLLYSYEIEDSPSTFLSSITVDGNSNEAYFIDSGKRLSILGAGDNGGNADGDGALYTMELYRRPKKIAVNLISNPFSITFDVYTKGIMISSFESNILYELSGQDLLAPSILRDIDDDKRHPIGCNSLPIVYDENKYLYVGCSGGKQQYMMLNELTSPMWFSKQCVVGAEGKGVHPIQLHRYRQFLIAVNGSFPLVHGGETTYAGTFLGYVCIGEYNQDRSAFETKLIGETTTIILGVVGPVVVFLIFVYSLIMTTPCMLRKT